MDVSSQPGAIRTAPHWFRTLDRGVRLAVMAFSCTLLVLMVLFTAYTVIMRYVFRDPPFWGDTVSLFCNIGLVFVAYSLAVRDREDIASEALHALLPPKGVTVLVLGWQVVTVLFGLFLAWFGLEAALTVPGQYWELGGLPKMVPMLALPVSGLLTAIAGTCSVVEELAGWSCTAPSVEGGPAGAPERPAQGIELQRSEPASRISMTSPES
ncbi:MAG TPA: TRAP transporter small permease [Burkholderiaceae bacterium]|nr:TRAP transporter small permease [Burkholderiaceae bacterium]